VNQLQASNVDLGGLKVLAMLPSHWEERAEYLVRLLSELKARWNWEISILGPTADLKAFRPLTQPSGHLFTTIDYRVPRYWEADPQALALAEQRLREAEIASRVPVGQLLLAAQNAIGCAFALPHLRVRPSSLTRQVLADNAEPYQMYLRLFEFADAIMDEAKPDLFLAYEWEKPWRSSVWMAAARRNIPQIAIRRSKLNGDHYFWTTDRTFFNSAANELAQIKRERGDSASEAARKKIDDFRNRPLTVKYIREKWELHSKKSRVKWHIDSRGLVKDLAAAAVGRGKGGKTRIRKAVEYNRRIIQAGRDKKFFNSFDAAELASMKYIYFPMHKETDLPLVFQATAWQDQRNMVQLIAASLPYGYKLLVREHRLNFGQRPKNYYKHLLALPNVVLIDWADSQFKYLRHADLIVTENGSSGWEGIKFRRKVLTVAPNFYDGAGLSECVYDANQLAAKILEVLSRPDITDADKHDRKIGAMIDAEAATAFDGDAAGTERATDMLAQWLVQLRNEAAA
jgi:hypothetical protein